MSHKYNLVPAMSVVGIGPKALNSMDSLVRVRSKLTTAGWNYCKIYLSFPIRLIQISFKCVYI